VLLLLLLLLVQMRCAGLLMLAGQQTLQHC
jgi:hypothetical protein